MSETSTARTFPDPTLYSLNRENSRRAIEAGLAEADWYQCPVSRQEMRKLLIRKNGPAIRDTLIWFGILFATGGATALLWGTWWAVVPYLVYAAIYAGSADSRWHEAAHGTPFKTDWLNTALYEIASFMVMRESTVWRWSHTRHHSDTIIIGRDPEIAVPRPPDLQAMFFGVFAIQAYPDYFGRLIRHARGVMGEREREFIPESEHPVVFRKARFHLTIYLATLASAFLLQSWLPIFLVVFPHFFGRWMMVLYGLTQHTGLAEDVLDHRLNSRTFRTSLINRFLYWNMNYHVEHHMFPLVPYHALPRLHEIVRTDCPPPYPSLWSCWKEIVPAVIRQTEEPGYHVRRTLPNPIGPKKENHPTKESKERDGWLLVGHSDELSRGEIFRADYQGKTYAVYRNEDGLLYATDGICTHGNTHLADGLIVDSMIECPKHNGRFNLSDGSPARPPVCQALRTHQVATREGEIWLKLPSGKDDSESFTFEVVSNQNVATFIKELVLKPVRSESLPDFNPGDYLQLKIPKYETIHFYDFDIADPYRKIWEAHGLFELQASNQGSTRRNNYSIANLPARDAELRFNVRIATPPRGQDCPPGVGSSYVFNLKPGDQVKAIGPFGDFHIKPTKREMVYLGGGAGMAPMRAHLAHLLEVEKSPRKIHFWYGARSRQEIFYHDYFEKLATRHKNFDFQLVLSEPLELDNWKGLTGMVHDSMKKNLLEQHPDIQRLEFYLCGPPVMIEAAQKMLSELSISPEKIACDAF